MGDEAVVDLIAVLRAAGYESTARKLADPLTWGRSSPSLTALDRECLLRVLGGRPRPSASSGRRFAPASTSHPASSSGASSASASASGAGLGRRQRRGSRGARSDRGRHLLPAVRRAPRRVLAAWRGLHLSVRDRQPPWAARATRASASNGRSRPSRRASREGRQGSPRTRPSSPRPGTRRSSRRCR